MNAPANPKSDDQTPFGSQPSGSRTGLWISGVAYALWFAFLVAMAIHAGLR